MSPDREQDALDRQYEQMCFENQLTARIGRLRLVYGENWAEHVRLVETVTVTSIRPAA